VGHQLTSLVATSGVPTDAPYPQLIGALMYLMVCTRPDIAYALSVLARFMAEGRHTTTHWAAAKRVLQYLKRTKFWTLTIGGTSQPQLLGHCDASWADNHDDRRSTLGFCFSLGDGLISWKATRSHTQALSSAEAEYYAGTEAVKEGTWTVGLLQELGVNATPYTLLSDSMSAIHMTENPVCNGRTKHIELKYHFIRSCVKKKQVVMEYVPTANNTADCFTKALPAPRHWELCLKFMTDGTPLDSEVCDENAPDAFK
jgi:hypothetical protein